MGDEMVRTFQHLRLDMNTCLGLREAIRPGVQEDDDPTASRAGKFCCRLYLAFYSLEADPDLEAIDFPIQPSEVMIINNFVSAEDGDWAKDILHQTRQVLYELTTGHEAVRLASFADSKLTEWPVDPEPPAVPVSKPRKRRAATPRKRRAAKSKKTDEPKGAATA